uniref:Uncharacterized protein n=1 Tax=Setaria italica TaxID=4555 RepID=K3Z1N1_SETIT
MFLLRKACLSYYKHLGDQVIYMISSCIGVLESMTIQYFPR